MRKVGLSPERKSHPNFGMIKKMMAKLLKSQKGQSLLEIVVMIGVLVVIVTGLVIVTINGLKNSQFSKNQLQATKLAQAGLEQVRTIKNRNCPVVVGNDSYWWFNAPLLVWGESSVDNTNFQIILDDSRCELKQSLNPDFFNNQFSRFVEMRNDPAGGKLITVRVIWSDFSGSHEAKHVTILASN